MKKATILIAFMSAMMQVYAQDTLYECDRVNNYIYDYYGNVWLDTYDDLCNGNNACLYVCTQWSVMPSWNGRPFIMGRYCETDSIKIVGVAAPVFIDSVWDFISDPLVSHRVAEYFYLYELTDSGDVYVARTRWDTASPNKTLCAPFVRRNQGHEGPMKCFPIYEAYFDKAILVYDSFYVGGSMLNNTAELTSGTFDHPPTYYLWWRNIQMCSNVYDYYGKNPLKDLNSADTSWKRNPDLYPGFGCIFPIFDTSTVTPPEPPEDTCFSPVNLRVLDMTEDNAVLGWVDNTGYLWQLSLVRDTLLPADSGSMSTHFNNFVNLTGLDTAQWYTAWVRTICDVDLRSEWSDSVRFYVGDNGISGIRGTTTDRYTRMMPNPAHGQVQVLSSFALRSLELYTVDGKMVKRQTASGVSATMDVSGVARGQYLMRIDTNGGSTVKRLVVE